jgi:hypothetical protein
MRQNDFKTLVKCHLQFSVSESVGGAFLLPQITVGILLDGLLK